MQKLFQTICFVFIFLCTSCSGNVSFKKQKSVSLTIDIQPFSDIAIEDAQYVFKEIGKVYPNTVLKKSIVLPQSAFYSLRNRYRADSLINFLNRNTTENHVTIGLTNKDISATKDSIADWGVMGLGFCPGKACIASTFRLSKHEKMMQFFKVAIHELGDTQGLPHCAINSCYMRDAEGHNPTNEEKNFCIDCKKRLENKGWIFISAL
jgi:archaemetzincin